MREGMSKREWENKREGERGGYLQRESEEDIISEKVCERDILRVRKSNIGK